MGAEHDAGLTISGLRTPKPRWFLLFVGCAFTVLLFFLTLKLCALRTENTASLKEPMAGRGR